MDSCSIDLSCDSTKLLNCSVTGENLYKCQCPPYYYWSTNMCYAMLSDTDPCTSTSQCRGDLGLVCSTTCSCLNTHYWNGTMCTRKIQYNQPCTAVSQCDNTIGLTTCSTNCICPNLYFYNGTACRKHF